MQSNKKSRCGGGSKSLWRQSNYSYESLKLQAMNQWRAILTAAGIAESFLSGKHGPCPACGGKDRFRFDNKAGTGSFFCSHCGPGDGFTLLQNVFGLSASECLLWVKGLLRNGSVDSFESREPVDTKYDAVTDTEKLRGRLNQLWFESQPVASNNAAGRYLDLRIGAGTSDDAPATLRHHNRLPLRMSDGSFEYHPALVCMVQDAAGVPLTLHRIYVTETGCKPFADNKRLMSPLRPNSLLGSAIRLGEPHKKLGIAEGVETGLACQRATGIPTWAAISASGMAAVKVPQCIEELTLFADHDSVGQKAAEKLAARAYRDGKTVRIAVPPRPGDDWLDELNRGHA